MKAFTSGFKFFLATFILFVTTFLTLGIIFSSVKATGPVEPFSFSVKSGTEKGTVKVTWYDDNSVHGYNLLYGTNINHFNYGVVNMAHGKYQVNEFTVGYLTPGQNYYFKLIGLNGGQDIDSDPLLARAALNNNTTVQPTYYSASKNYLMPYLFALNYGAGSGSVTITWFANESANKYDIVYGTSPGHYQFGWQDMAYRQNLSNTFTVGALTPGTTYYFSLVAERNNTVVSWTDPLSITVR